MGIRVNREELLATLQSVSAGVSQKVTFEQSNCIVFDGGRVLTFDDKVSCSAPSKLGNKFKGVIQAKKLLELLQKLPEDEIDLEPSDGELLIIGKGGKRAGVGMQADILLPVHTVEKPGKWKKLPEDFSEAVQLVASCADTDESRFTMGCVHFTARWIEASDNMQAIRYRMKMGAEKSFLVERKSLKHLTVLGMTEFSETEAWVHFRNPKDLVISCRRYLEEFRDLTSALDVVGKPATLPGGLKESVALAEIFSAEDKDDNTIFVKLSKGKLRLKGEGISGWYEEPKTIKYDGPTLEFLVSPKILTKLADKYNEVEITHDRLKVTGEHYQYITCLMKAGDGSEPRNGHVEPVAVSEEEVPADKVRKRKKWDEEEEE